VGASDAEIDAALQPLDEAKGAGSGAAPAASSQTAPKTGAGNSANVVLDTAKGGASAETKVVQGGAKPFLRQAGGVLRSSARTVGKALPFVGAFASGYSAGENLDKGNYGEATLDIAETIPVVGFVVFLARIQPIRAEQEVQQENWNREHGLPPPRPRPY
jgi:hypothetical protein